MDPEEFYGHFCGKTIVFSDTKTIEAEGRNRGAPMALTFRDVARLLRSLNDNFAAFGLGTGWSLLARTGGGFRYTSSPSGKSAKYLSLQQYGAGDHLVEWPWLTEQVSRSISECDLIENDFSNKLFFDFAARRKLYYTWRSEIAMEDAGTFLGWSDLEKAVALSTIMEIINPKEVLPAKAAPIDPSAISAEIRAERISVFKNLVRVVTQAIPTDWGQPTQPRNSFLSCYWTQELMKTPPLAVTDLQNLAKKTLFTNRVISLRSLSHPILLKTKLYIVAKDLYGDVVRVEISPLPTLPHSNLVSLFAPGTSFELLHPQLNIDLTGDKYLSIENLDLLDAGGTYTPVCYVCEKRDHSFKCSACGVATYCSPECQKLDWSTQRHKELCPIMIKQLKRG